MVSVLLLLDLAPAWCCLSSHSNTHCIRQASTDVLKAEHFSDVTVGPGCIYVSHHCGSCMSTSPQKFIGGSAVLPRSHHCSVQRAAGCGAVGLQKDPQVCNHRCAADSQPQTSAQPEVGGTFLRDSPRGSAIGLQLASAAVIALSSRALVIFLCHNMAFRAGLVFHWVSECRVDSSTQPLIVR